MLKFQQVFILDMLHHFMLKADPDSPKLTEHDKDVLRKIIEHSRIPDSKIAEDVGISPQAVFKIRNKLEELGIIQGYTPIIDFKKIGIQVLAILIIRIKPEAWSRYQDFEISARICKIPYVIAAYRVANAQASHILVMGFRDTQQKEYYLNHMQTENADDVEIKESYTFSVDQIITQNPIGLLNDIIDKKDISKYELFPGDKKK
jgi:Lrp/AsnC family transcriptional regulator, leucine-responsive regulatory protein